MSSERMPEPVEAPDADGAARFNRNLFQAGSPGELPWEAIRASLGRHHVAALRGIVGEEDAGQARAQLSARFRRADDHPSTGESPDSVKGNFQKLLVGSVHSRHHEGSYARLARTFYNPLLAPDIYGMHAVFRRLIAVRNGLLGKPADFATDRVEDGVWTAARIHQYPIGGGFMGAHRDTTLAGVANQATLNYFQVLMLLSRKGVDFETGGGYLDDEYGRLVLDDHCLPGDIVIYDGSSVHGVADIDPHRPLNLDSVCGRIAAFVSLYRDL